MIINKPMKENTMRQVKASDFVNAFEFKQAQKAERKASKQGRQSRHNGRGKAFQIEAE